MMHCKSGESLKGQAKSPQIRLWIFNHPIRGITEQIEFFVLAMRTQGYCVTVSRNPSPTALNVVIENFTPESVITIREFCKTHGKRVAVINTEHLDFVDGNVHFHGRPLGTDDDYMPAVSRRARLLHLTILTEYTFCFFRLGDLPALVGINDMYPGVSVHTIPFPKLHSTDRSRFHERGSVPRHDLVFSGKVTDYRRHILAILARYFRVQIVDSLLSRRCRDAANADARFVLNIPQRADWKWPSSMRILAALRCGRATVSVNTGGEWQISEFCINISDAALASGAAELKPMLESYRDVSSRKLLAYNTFVESAKNTPFPHGVFALWGEIESQPQMSIA